MAGTFCDDVSVSSNTTLGAAHMNHLILATAGAGGITLTLPDNATWHNSYTCIWRVDAAAGNVVIARAGSDTINGATSITLSNQYETVCLYSNGAGLWEAVFGSRLLTAGSVPFAGANGLLAQDNANLFWDATLGGLFFGPNTGFSDDAEYYRSVSSHHGTNLNAPTADMLSNGEAYGLAGIFEAGNALTNNEHIFGIVGSAQADSTAVVGQTVGVFGEGFSTSAGSSSVDGVRGIAVSKTSQTNSGASFHAMSPAGVDSGTFDTAYGLRVENITLGNTNYAIKTGLGLVDFGDMLQLSRGFTVAAGANVLPTPTVGMVARVTDALAPAVGAVLAGGGAAAALVWYNGANWTVIGV